MLCAVRQKSRPVPICSRTDTMYVVCKRLVQTRKQRLIVVEPHTRICQGTVSLSDIFQFILDLPDRTGASRPGPAVRYVAWSGRMGRGGLFVDPVWRAYERVVVVVVVVVVRVVSIQMRACTARRRRSGRPMSTEWAWIRRRRATGVAMRSVPTSLSRDGPAPLCWCLCVGYDSAG